MSVKRYEANGSSSVSEDANGSLVDYSDYVALEARCLKLAAENAGLKDLARGWANANDDRLFEAYGEIFHDSIDACEEELKTIRPATDAFLAEVRAQGVEMFAKEMHADISGDDAREFAAQLRKGVQS